MAPHWILPPELDGARLDKALRTLSSDSWGRVRKLVERGKVRVDDRAALDAGETVVAGARIEVDMQARRPRSMLARSAIVHVDGSVVVVNKPAGMSTVPYGDEPPAEQRRTLDALVRDAIAHHAGRRGRQPLGVVQRLDKDTSGLIVFARTVAVKRHLSSQLRAHSMHRRYLAIAHGDVAAATIRSRLVKNRGDGLRGSTDNPRLGQLSVTHVEPLESMDGATLVSCRLETGRTHQIRIHLAERGHPLVGERVYIRDYRGPRLEAPRQMLHATELGFELHSGKSLRFHCDPPADFEALLAQLREAKR